MRIKVFSLFLFAVFVLASISTGNEEKPKPASVHVKPAKFVLQDRWSSQTLVVMGRLPDGSVRDITSEAEFKSGNPAVVEVNKEGFVKPVSDGQTTISVLVSVGDTKVSTETRVTVKDYQNDFISFRRHVMPLL
ncbi:MAG: Ig-like domain-containing protein, partial [bacterium]